MNPTPEPAREAAPLRTPTALLVRTRGSCRDRAGLRPDVARAAMQKVRIGVADAQAQLSATTAGRQLRDVGQMVDKLVRSVRGVMPQHGKSLSLGAPAEHQSLHPTLRNDAKHGMHATLWNRPCHGTRALARPVPPHMPTRHLRGRRRRPIRIQLRNVHRKHSRVSIHHRSQKTADGIIRTKLTRSVDTHEAMRRAAGRPPTRRPATRPPPA